MTRPFRAARWVLVPVVLLAGGAFWYLDAYRDTVDRTEVVRPVEVVQPSRSDLEDRFSVRAFVEAEETVTILPLVSGRIDRLAVDVGDAVAVDEVIAQLDPERYALDLAQAEASFNAAESTFLRTRQLYEADATSVQDYDRARAQFEAAQSSRDLAELQLDYTTVRSPISGVILVRHLAAGDVAAPERPIVTIGDISRLTVRPAVPEDRFAEFARRDSSPENAITVRVSAGGRTYPARIRTVAPYVTAETRTFEVVCEIDGDLSLLRPGMSVSVTFVPAVRRDLLTLPAEALGYGDTLWYVDDDSAHRIDAPNPRAVDGRIVVPEDYAGRRFIVRGHHFLSEGQAVQVRGASR